MLKILVAYYPLGEAPKVANKLIGLLENNDFKVTRFEININQDFNIKQQFKDEKKLTIINQYKSLKEFDFVFIGTPIVSFSSAPAINAFIRNLAESKNKKVFLFATGIGLPGKAIKKMSSLLSMKGIQVVDSVVFSSIFEFDERKLKEVELFLNKIKPKLK